jgi:hypothetical protein
VQRDAPDAARGRSFARFETRFQVVWVAGGVLAVAFPGGGRSGVFLVALVMLGAGLTYVGAIRRPPAVRPPAESQWRRLASRAVPHRRARPAASPRRPEPPSQPPPHPPPSPPEVPSGT